jgi:glucose/arabinose dehydrogenase
MRNLYVRLLTILICVVTLSYLSGCGGSSTGRGSGGSGSGSDGGSGAGSGASVALATDKTLHTEVVASNLEGPWSMIFAPDGRLFFTERPGRLRVMTNSGVVPTPVLDLTSVTVGGEGGTTGMDLDPNFSSNGYVYIHFCLNDGTAHCRVDRVIVDSNNNGTIDKVLLDYPVNTGVFDHTGGRLRISPDHFLYLSTGDHTDDQSAQDLTSWNGKILRMNLDGTPAAGNPFPTQNAYVYSYGHRDPQGLAWDSSGQLYETEHGPTSNDEVNIIYSGKNYGWPQCVGICNNPAYVDPVKLFSPQTAPPSGATFYSGSLIPGWDGSFLFAVLGLNGNTYAQHVHQLKFDKPGGTQIVFEQILWQNQFGRIRDVVEAPDGSLYFSTGLTVQMLATTPGGDKIIRAHP